MIKNIITLQRYALNTGLVTKFVNYLFYLEKKLFQKKVWFKKSKCKTFVDSFLKNSVGNCGHLLVKPSLS